MKETLNPLMLCFVGCNNSFIFGFPNWKVILFSLYSNMEAFLRAKDVNEVITATAIQSCWSALMPSSVVLFKYIQTRRPPVPGFLKC